MVTPNSVKFSIKDLNIWFGQHQALKSVNMEVFSNEILSVIGPSNSGKTTFLRMLNRLNELQPSFKMRGSVELDGKNINELVVELFLIHLKMI